ncbi:MAG: metallopeptidase [Oscillospiraceae bacterium]|nr:metallopeptidase [Oscillospiraceae bacterium]
MELTKSNLLVNMRFLDMALNRLKLSAAWGVPYATNGSFMCYEPKHVLSRYKMERELPARDYLHILLHCIFRHMYVSPGIDHTCWDLACDIMVEYIISELELKAVTTRRQKVQRAEIKQLERMIGTLTAEKIYRFYKALDFPPEKIAMIRGDFYTDDHRVWYLPPREQNKAMGLPEEDEGTGYEYEKSLENQEIEKQWRDVSQRMQMELEGFGKNKGDKAGKLIQNLGSVNRERYDYSRFLKKFAVSGEVMKINDEEFDNIFYTYGLKLYKKMPLIEPLEYQQAMRIKDFVIAIDTSASTSGRLVQKFVQKTYNILKSTESFFSKINLHIIQCDSKIQEDVLINSQEDFDQYLKTMKIRGHGGTDFRPVFAYMDELRRKKELEDLKGLIYFTDGYGTFPNRKPEYDTAFVFADEDFYDKDVPPWAIKLVLREDEI